ncbi:hypothetical protein [Psychromonas sp. SP041]|uniref:hypothetical protein n=1 Tax=Psychromonas sp. SP041 TaxID=1365007 RepID=UPI00047272B6|nr:hypothetical protein [Psychromonas sp. SP041]
MNNEISIHTLTVTLSRDAYIEKDFACDSDRLVMSFSDDRFDYPLKLVSVYSSGHFDSSLDKFKKGCMVYATGMLKSGSREIVASFPFGSITAV